MESFHQIELLMMSKMEPTSPSSSSSSNEDIIYEDNYANGTKVKFQIKLPQDSLLNDLAFFVDHFINELNAMDELMAMEHKKNVADILCELEGDKYLTEELVITHPLTVSTVNININKIKTEQLLMEFDSIYDELTHLTPPQTPPAEQFYLSNTQEDYNEQQHQFMYSPDLLTIDQEAIMTSPTPGELEVVAELLYSHTEKQCINASTSMSNADWNTDDDCSTSFTSSSFSPRSEDTSSVFSQDDDEQTKKSKSGLRGVSKKRTRPYARGGEDKKSRKKEQNKNAATRYRQKKKQEVEVILDEERILMNKNDKLMDTFQDTRREVKYLKSLLRDLFKARGFIQ
ncbi:unnamed protein product [Diamesa hyperborea]